MEEYLLRHSLIETDGIEESRRIHERIKNSILECYPQLQQFCSHEKMCRAFDHITEAIRQNMPFETLDEIERAIKGEDVLRLIRY